MHVVHPLLPITAQLLLQKAIELLCKIIIIIHTAACVIMNKKSTYVCTRHLHSCKRHELYFQLCHTHSSLVRELLQHRYHQASSWHCILYEVQIISLDHCMVEVSHNYRENYIRFLDGYMWYLITACSITFEFSYARLTLTALWCTSEASTAS